MSRWKKYVGEYVSGFTWGFLLGLLVMNYGAAAACKAAALMMVFIVYCTINSFDSATEAIRNRPAPDKIY